MYRNSMDKVVTLLAIFLKAKLWNTPLLLLLGAISKGSRSNIMNTNDDQIALTYYFIKTVLS